MATETVVRSSGGGVGFLGLLTIVFIALKLTGVVEWSWVWVLAPIWIPWLTTLALVILVGSGFAIFKLFENKEKRKNRELRRSLDRYAKSVVR